MLRYSVYSILAFVIPIFFLFVFSGSFFHEEGITSDVWNGSGSKSSEMAVKYKAKNKTANFAKSQALKQPTAESFKEDVTLKTPSEMAKKQNTANQTLVDKNKLIFPTGKKTFSLPSDEKFNPSKGSKFLLSFHVKFYDLPPPGLRQNLITKYNAKTFPYAGWGFGVSNLGTSVRPEFYWRAGNNSGGWFTFSDIEIELNTWYSFSVLASNNEYASVYVQKLSSESDAEKDAEKESTAQFLGGANLLGIRLPVSEGDVQIGPARGRGDGEDFKGELSSILIGKIDKVPDNLNSLEQFLSGGSSQIKNRINQSELALWLNG